MVGFPRSGHKIIWNHIVVVGIVGENIKLAHFET